MKLVTIFFATVAAMNVMATTPKLVCSPEDDHDSYQKIEVDRSRKAVALVTSTGISILKYEKTIVNKTSGAKFDQYEGTDMEDNSLQVDVNAEELRGNIYTFKDRQSISITCEEVDRLPHQHFINMATSNDNE